MEGGVVVNTYMTWCCLIHIFHWPNSQSRTRAAGSQHISNHKGPGSCKRIDSWREKTKWDGATFYGRLVQQFFLWTGDTVPLLSINIWVCCTMKLKPGYGKHLTQITQPFIRLKTKQTGSNMPKLVNIVEANNLKCCSKMSSKYQQYLCRPFCR